MKLKQTLFTLTALAGLSLAAPLTTCPPAIPLQDTVPIAASCGLTPLTATPNASYWFGWNDNPAKWSSNDFDFDDLFGTVVLNSTGTSATFTYLGSTALYFNTMYSDGTPMFNNYLSLPGASVTVATAPDSPISLILTTVTGIYGFEWESGDSNHLRSGYLTGCEPEPAHAPEPSAVLLGLSGIALISLGAWRKRRAQPSATALVNRVLWNTTSVSPL